MASQECRLVGALQSGRQRRDVIRTASLDAHSAAVGDKPKSERPRRRPCGCPGQEGSGYASGAGEEAENSGADGEIFEGEMDRVCNLLNRGWQIIAYGPKSGLLEHGHTMAKLRSSDGDPLAYEAYDVHHLVLCRKYLSMPELAVRHGGGGERTCLRMTLGFVCW